MLNIIVSIVLLVTTSDFVNGHGRLMEPPNRSSLWRLDDYKQFYPEANYDDNQIWCGGIGTQYKENGGKCGPCGDAWQEKKPRDNEDGGRFGRGIIARVYSPGQVINIAVDLTANHLGHFEFNLCPLTYPEDEECFKKYPLPLADGSGTKYMVPRNDTGYYNTSVVLPKDLKCKQCSLRWHYRTANRWNFVTNTTGEVGAGDQEIFRTCSDITIGTFPPVVPRPPTHKIPPEEMSGKPPTWMNSSTTTTTTPKPIQVTKPPSTVKPPVPTKVPKPPMPTKPPAPPAPTTSKPSKPAPSMPAQRPPMTTMPASTTTTTTMATTSVPLTTDKTSTIAIETPQPQTEAAATPSRPHLHPIMKPPNSAPKNDWETNLLFSYRF